LVLPIGSTVGAILIGLLMDRFAPHYVLACSYALAAGFIVMLGMSTSMPWLLVVAVFGAGFGTGGSQVGINALAAAFCPTSNRATGVSWANAVGRTGSVLVRWLSDTSCISAGAWPLCSQLLPSQRYLPASARTPRGGCSRNREGAGSFAGRRLNSLSSN
jgi:AAHS family 4-hydroxybenzoate transporter-like MFS transporter